MLCFTLFPLCKAMQILLSCAKDMAKSADFPASWLTTPYFQQTATSEVQQLMQCSVDELKTMLHCNDKIALLNKLRYERFFDDTPLMPAALAYAGQAFRHLCAKDWTEDVWQYATDHLYFTSFLYGLLRPTDGIRTYRLEGTARRPETGERYFEFWRPLLTDLFIESIKVDDGILVNLASEEMKGMFDWKRVEQEVTVVQPEFMVEKAEGLKTIVVYTKMCRGAMARYLLTHRCTTIEELRCFEYEGFAYRNDWLFVL